MGSPCAGGPGVGVTIDATTSERSFAELALPIGVTLFRTIELVYRPMLSVPLGSESSAVFGAERELATRLAVHEKRLAYAHRTEMLGSFLEVSPIPFHDGFVFLCWVCRRCSRST
ncbi:MAG TPA: hypothetical protein VIK01_06295 [Polyangiaceae bacterium]